jgi:hypothetical protein
MTLQADPFITWLLHSTTPTVRYRTLTDLLGYPADDARVVEARQAIMTSGPVPAILARQTDTGAWQDERSYYTPKYFSTQWSMILLNELDVDGQDARFQQGVRHMLDATAHDLSGRMDTHTLGFSCFWANLLRYALRAGLAADARVEKLIRYAVYDLQQGPCRCVHNAGVACAWGIVRTLWGLAAVLQTRRADDIDQAIQQGVGFLLDSFHLIEADYPGVVNPLWFKLNFPLFYQVDILFTLRVLDELGMLAHPGAQAALDWLAQRRGRDGRWLGTSPFRQRTWPEMGAREETTRWVSLHSARILRHANRLPTFA